MSFRYSCESLCSFTICCSWARRLPWAAKPSSVTSTLLKTGRPFLKVNNKSLSCAASSLMSPAKIWHYANSFHLVSYCPKSCHHAHSPNLLSCKTKGVETYSMIRKLHGPAQHIFATARHSLKLDSANASAFFFAHQDQVARLQDVRLTC